MHTEVLAAGKPGTNARAIELLRRADVVALPTETVYGLAADALHLDAISRIFEAKGRPRFDPLIVHLPAPQALDLFALVQPKLVRILVEEFWPGPLTILLPKRAIVPDLATAGLETVALRMSAHSTFMEVISAFGGPLAAPSANRFGHISPTTAQHVDEELGGRIPLIIDAGPTKHGIESTIVRVVGETIEILRQGAVTAEQLRGFGPVSVHERSGAAIAPGQLPSHYAPRTKLMVVEELAKFAMPQGKAVGALSLRPSVEFSLSSGAIPTPSSRGATVTLTPADSRSARRRLAQGGLSASLRRTEFAAVRCLSASGDLREAAANLFRMLRELDSANLDLIVAEKVPEQGVGVAINERLLRAASR